MNSRALIDPTAADRLAKLCGLFSSDHDGERASAAAMADKLVRSLGLTWPDVIAPGNDRGGAPPRDWREMARECRASAHLLTHKELAFISNMCALEREPSAKQTQWLSDIYARVTSC